jgi:hypothetical protein
MQLEIFISFQQLGLILVSLYLFIIESWWLDFTKFTLKYVYLRNYSLPPNNRHTWVDP